MGVEPPIKNLPARNELKVACSSHEKVRRCFGMPKLVSLRDGAEKMAAWVKKHGAGKSQKSTNIENTKKFPAVWLD